MHHSPEYYAYYASWLGPRLLQSLLVLILLRDGLWRRLPWFVALNVFQITKTAILATLALLGWSVYGIIYWVGEPLEILLIVAVGVESLLDLLVPYPAFAAGLRSFLKWAVPITIVGSAIFPFLWPATTAGTALFKELVAAKWAASIAQVAFFIVAYTVIHRLGLGIRRVPFGVVAGLLFSAALDVISRSATIHSSLLSLHASAWFTFAANFGSVVIWLAVCMSPATRSAELDIDGTRVLLAGAERVVANGDN